MMFVWIELVEYHADLQWDDLLVSVLFRVVTRNVLWVKKTDQQGTGFLE